MPLTKNLIFTVLLTILAGMLYGQRHYISVVDSSTREPVAFANVCIEDLKTGKQSHSLTDINGNIENKCTGTCLLAVSCMGYKTLTDTIIPAKEYKYVLVANVFNISEVIVTAQFTPERVDKSIYKVKVLNSKTIEQKAASNLSQLLSSESNIRIDQSGLLGSSLIMQGLTGENIKILVDGVPVVGRINGNIDLDQLNLFNVDHVEIVEGPMSVVYGTNAIAGVINIITKEQKTSALNLQSNAYYETVGVYNFNFSSSGRKNRHSFYTDVSRNFFDGYNNEIQSREMLWKPRRQNNADAYWLYSGNNFRFKLSAQFFHEKLVDKGALMGPYYETAIDELLFTRRLILKTEGTHTLSPKRNINWVVSYAGYHRIRNVYNNDLTKLLSILSPVGDTTGIGNFLLRSMYFSNRDKFKLSYQAGLDFNYEWMQGERIGNGIKSICDFAGFISVKYTPVKNLDIQPGVRYMYNTRYKAPLIYSFNAKFTASSEFIIRATYARGFRAPSLKELYLDFVDINHSISGNDSLEAEKSNNSTLVFSYTHETHSEVYNSELSIFYNNILNTIWLFNTGESDVSYTYGNVARYQTHGITLNTGASFYPSVSIKAGYTLTGRRFPLNSVENTRSEFHYSNDMSFIASYLFIKYDLQLSLIYRHSGKYPRLTPDSEYDGGYTGGYNMIDITMMKHVFNEKLGISVGAKNLLNVKDVSSSGAVGTAHSGSADGISRVAWGRSFFVKLNYNFTRH